MAQVAKRKLSGSTDGRGVKVAATATPGTLIHTAVTGTTTGTFDEIWLYLYNSSTADVVCTVELGGVTAPDDNVVVTIPFKQGRFLVLDGAILQNGTVLRVFAGTTNVIIATGFVNAITA